MTIDQPTLSEDDRYELAGRANAVERRNRPRGLVVLGVAVMLIGVVSVGVGYMRDRGARSDLARQEDQLGELVGLDATLTTLHNDQEGRGRSDKLDPVPNLLTQLEELAIDAGLGKPPTPQRRSDREREDARLQRIKISYSQLRHADPAVLLGWVNDALDLIPGLEVFSISVRPGTNDWTMSVTYSRWERKGAS